MNSQTGWHARVWSLTWPVILANLTIPLVGLVDTAIMGRMPDPSHIGAVALGSTAFTAMYWLFGFLRMGTTGLTAQAFGANERAELWAIALRGALLAVLLALLMLALQALLRRLAFDLIFDGSAQVETLARDYFDIRIWSIRRRCCISWNWACCSACSACGQRSTSASCSTSPNALLDYWFVMHWQWGVSGVAFGTLISEWLAALVGLRIVYNALSRHADAPPKALWLRVKAWGALRRLANLSANLVIRTFFVQAPFLMFTAIGATFGDVTLAANAVLLQLFFVSVYAMDAFAHTAENTGG